MKPQELFESAKTNLLVVDVQPAYAHHCQYIIPKVCDLINHSRGKVIILFNGSESSTTEDTLFDVQDYFLENGLDEELLHRIDFVEKEYGFFRCWMDYQVTDRVIIKVIRAMQLRQIHDALDLDLTEILTPEEFAELPEDTIYFPGFMDINLLRQLSPFYMIGGGRNECLREIELICNAFNIRYKRINSLIY